MSTGFSESSTGFYESPQAMFAPMRAGELSSQVSLFGGPRVLKHKLATPLDAHEMILDGIPSRAFTSFVEQLEIVAPSEAFAPAIGMSLRTFQRYKADGQGKLSPDQSARAWTFAGVLARAIAVLGSQQEAERWMLREAIGLDNRRPIELLATPVGTELVQTYLDRMDYGVYA